MAWLNNKRAPSNAGVPETTKHSFDVPVKLRIRGIQEPVQATLLHIAVAGCRLRSWMLMERGSGVSFDWRLSDGKLLELNGVVAARYAPRNGGVGFEYAVALEPLPHADADALSREAAMLARQTASARSYDTSLVDISQFTGYRVPDDFVLNYRGEDARITVKIARACDVTGNGLRIRCDEPLRGDQILMLQFTLPEHVLGVHKGKDDELVVGPFGYRRVPRKYLRRPFAELKLKARVLGSVKDSRRRDAYEVQFLEVDGMAREELARYIHASQLATLKR
jgi:hypothetical protein